MRTAAVTVTCRAGGLDVNEACLLAQTHKPTLWIIADELARYHSPREGLAATTVDTRPWGRPFSLCAAYNEAIDIARQLDIDLLVSMEDYMWIPPNGIERFEYLAELYPSALLTGLCSISKDPPASEVTHPHGRVSIFAEPYDGHKPQEIDWEDCRLQWAKEEYGHEGPIYENLGMNWEMNWAAIPRAPLHDKRLYFDEAYDEAIGHQNQDYAWRARHCGYTTVMDTSNHAIGLPHRSYFPEEAARHEPLRKANMEFHNRRWQMKPSALNEGLLEVTTPVQARGER